MPGWTLALPPPRHQSLGDFRVAVWADDPIAPVDAAVRERVLKVAKLVEEAGGQVDYEARPAFDAAHSHEQFTNLLQSAMSARTPEEQFQKALARRAELAPDDNSDLARNIRSSVLYYREWHQFNERRTHLRWAWHEFFKTWDVLLTPVCVSSAFPHDQNPQMGQRRMTVNNEERPYFEQVFWPDRGLLPPVNGVPNRTGQRGVTDWRTGGHARDGRLADNRFCTPGNRGDGRVCSPGSLQGTRGEIVGVSGVHHVVSEMPGIDGRSTDGVSDRGPLFALPRTVV